MYSGIANSGRPIRKCAGVNTIIPSIGVESNGTSGLLFMVASISAYCRLPKSSKIWCSARNMTPIDPLGDAKPIDLISD